MLAIILIIMTVLALMIWGGIIYLGRSQSLSVKSIEDPSGDIYLIHLTKPDDMTWKTGTFAKFELPNVKEIGGKSRWLTISSSSDDDEILILTHNSGSIYKKTLTNLPVGSKVEMSRHDSHFSVADDNEPIVCFASDVGIAAMRPIVKEWAGKCPIILNHLDKGVRVFDKEMAELSNQKDTFIYETSANLSQSQENLKKAADKYANKATYILSGQSNDIEAMKQFFVGKGIDIKKIKVDKFTGLK